MSWHCVVGRRGDRERSSGDGGAELEVDRPYHFRSSGVGDRGGRDVGRFSDRADLHPQSFVAAEPLHPSSGRSPPSSVCWFAPACAEILCGHGCGRAWAMGPGRSGVRRPVGSVFGVSGRGDPAMPSSVVIADTSVIDVHVRAYRERSVRISGFPVGHRSRGSPRGVLSLWPC